MMNRSKLWMLAAPAIVASAALAAPVGAQDSDEVALAKKLVDRGIFEPADTLLEPVKPLSPDGMVVRGRALSGMARDEKDAGRKRQLVAEATKLLEEAVKKNAKGAQQALDKVKAGTFEGPPSGNFEANKEVEFAQKLLFRGMVGAADAVIEGALKTASGEDKVAGLGLRAQIYVARSRARETPPEKRKEFFEKAKAVYDDLLKNAPKQDDVFNAREGLYELYIARANGLAESAKREADLQAQDALKKEALDAYVEAENFFQAENKKWSEEKDKGAAAPAPGGDQPSPAPGGGEGEGAPAAKKTVAEEAHMLSGYYYPKAMVGHGSMLPKGDEHDKILKAAIDFYAQYNLEYGQEFIGFEAAIDMGDAYKELGNEEDALGTYKAALDIEKLYNDDPFHPDPKKHLNLPPIAVDVYARAALKIARIYIAKHDSKKAVVTLDRVFFHDPKFGESSALGTQIVIERAEAKAGESPAKKAEALKELEEIIKKDPTGAGGVAARAAQARISGKRRSGGGGDENFGVDMETAVTRGVQALESNDIPTATLLVRLAIGLAPGDAKGPKLLPRAYLLLGEIYFAQGRLYEAAIAFEEVMKRWPQSKPEGPDAGLKQVQCYHTLNAKTPNQFDREKYDDALKNFERTYPTEGAGAVQFLLGLSEMEEGNYAKAIEQFEQVKEASGAPYDKSRYFIGVCRYFEAQRLRKEKKDPKDELEKAVASLKKAIDVYAVTANIPEDRQKSRKDLDTQSRGLLADIYLTLEKPDDVLALLEKVDESSPDKLGKAGLLRIHAWEKQGNVEKAEAQLKIVLEKARQTKQAILASKTLAGMIDRTLLDPKKKKDLKPEDVLSMTQRASDYYTIWMLEGAAAGDAPSSREQKTVADRLFDMGYELAQIPENRSYIWQLEKIDPKGGKQVFDNCAKIYSQIKDDKAQKDRVLILARAGECFAFAGNWKEAVVAFEAARDEAKIIVPDGDPKRMIPKGGLDRDLLQKRPELLGWYFDLGRAYVEQAQPIGDKAERGPVIQRGLDCFANVLQNAPEGGESWWTAKWSYFHGLDLRGEQADFESIKVGLRSLERANPNWDNGKYGIKDKFLELKKKVEK